MFLKIMINRIGKNLSFRDVKHFYLILDTVSFIIALRRIVFGLIKVFIINHKGFIRIGVEIKLLRRRILLF